MFHLNEAGLTSKCSARQANNVILIITCTQLTKSARSTGPEKIGSERPLPGLLALRSVLSLSRITLKHHGKIRPQPDREKLFSRLSGGGTGTGIGPSLVDAALICKEFLNLSHVIECGLLSGLLARPDRCRWPRWRCADRGQISNSELEALRRFLVCPTRIMSIICPFGSCLPHNSAFRSRVLLPDQAALAITGSR
jgi:hypothetical protein